jgi:halimadienyl-diphosphate synthase
MEDFHSLLRIVGTSRLSHTAYDTAWVARLSDIDRDISNQALDWISNNQLPDGSWGVEQPMYYHDRVVCTLSAMVALTYRGRRSKDKQQIEKGLASLEAITSGATEGLKADHSGATVGFELIVPILVAEAVDLGLIKQQKEGILGELTELRKAKMAKFAGQKISRSITLSHSAEIVGKDGIDLLDIDNLQETNGSVGASPSATAHFALYAKLGDESALNYLRRLMKGGDGGSPAFSPMDQFERIWMLWNLSLTGLHKTDNEIKALCAPHLDYLEKRWQPGLGLSFSENFSPHDGDDTSVGFEVLSKFGKKPDLDTLLSYEEKNWFRCYKAERNPSIDANVDFLGAFHQVGYDKSHPSVKKILAFIRSMRRPEGYWLDKWNISPYYTTTRAIILCKGYDDDLCQASVDWMLKEQQANGSWGSYGLQTAEETAYCIQALKIWQMYRGNVSKEPLEKAKLWLSRNCEAPYPLLWIDKSLYSPEILVKSSIISALMLAEM